MWLETPKHYPLRDALIHICNICTNDLGKSVHFRKTHHKLTLYFVARHAVRFIPRENGVHFVHVTLDRHHIRGSPFKVIVGEQEPDPGVVTASGKGLKTAETG